MDIKKRGKGKNSNCLGMQAMYRYYVANYKEPITYELFATIIKACNKEIVRQVTVESATVQLPYRLGKIQVCKFERSYNQPQNKWKIDWKRSREEGIRVYFDQKYIYKWCWKKHNSIVKNKTGYKFTPCRAASRVVPKLLATKKIDYLK